MDPALTSPPAPADALPDPQWRAQELLLMREVMRLIRSLWKWLGPGGKPYHAIELPNE